MFAILSFGPLPILILLKLFWEPSDLLLEDIGLMTRMRDERIGLDGQGGMMGRSSGSMDLVFSYYNEPLSRFSDAVDYVRRQSQLSVQNPRVIVYVKHPQVSLTKIAKEVGADEVIRLKNVGREGGTYLAHILRHYNSSLSLDSLAEGTATSVRGLMMSHDYYSKVLDGRPEFGLERISRPASVYGLADHTVFMQPEISWHWIAKPRMDLFDPSSTGFLSFGPYLISVCGQDGLGNGNYERMRDIYTLIYDSFCPPTGQLASYAGQFVVSRRRILRNRYEKYLNLRNLLEAPIEHWIHREGGWFKWKGSTDEGPAKNPTGPHNPFLGHALERSWPVIFDCRDPSIAESCTDEIIDQKLCQCFD